MMSLSDFVETIKYYCFTIWFRRKPTDPNSAVDAEDDSDSNNSEKPDDYLDPNSENNNKSNK